MRCLLDATPTQALSARDLFRHVRVQQKHVPRLQNILQLTTTIPALRRNPAQKQPLPLRVMILRLRHLQAHPRPQPLRAMITQLFHFQAMQVNQLTLALSLCLIFSHLSLLPFTPLISPFFSKVSGIKLALSSSCVCVCACFLLQRPLASDTNSVASFR